MPAVHRFDGFRVVVYPNDHRPAHVHVVGAAREAVFILNCPDGPPTLRESFGFKPSELRPIADELVVRLGVLCAKWETIHGPY